MNENRDPLLQALFDDADEPLADEAFTEQLRRNMAGRRRRILATRIAVIALLVLLEILLESPLRQSLGTVAETLGTSLIPLGDGWLAFVLAPVNSIAGVLGAVLLGVHTLYRRIVA